MSIPNRSRRTSRSRRTANRTTRMMQMNHIRHLSRNMNRHTIQINHTPRRTLHRTNSPRQHSMRRSTSNISPRILLSRTHQVRTKRHRRTQRRQMSTTSHSRHSPTRHAQIRITSNPIHMITRQISNLSQRRQAFRHTRTMRKRQSSRRLSSQINTRFIPHTQRNRSTISRTTPQKHRRSRQRRRTRQLNPIQRHNMLRIIQTHPRMSQSRNPRIRSQRPMQVRQPLNLLQSRMMRRPRRNHNRRRTSHIITMPPLRRHISNAKVSQMTLPRTHQGHRTIRSIRSHSHRSRNHRRPIHSMSILRLTLSSHTRMSSTMNSPSRNSRRISQPFRFNMLLTLNSTR